MRTISQRELRNDSGAIIRGLEAGEEFQLTVAGRVVGVLRLDRPAPGPRRFVDGDELVRAFDGVALTPEQRRAWLGDIDDAAGGDQMDDDPWAGRG